MRVDFFSFVGNTVFSRTVMTILDILVVAFLIYKIISLFKDTQAMSLIKGLAVLFGINIIANYMRLDALNWILATGHNGGVGGDSGRISA